MIKFFRSIRKNLLSEGNTKSYFKYAIGEIVLVVIGILIALSINNWSANKKSSHDKEVVISKIKDEIFNNSEQLDLAMLVNHRILKAYKDYKTIYNGDLSELITTPKKLAKFQKNYPKFFRIKDSIQLDNGLYHYSGGTFVELEIPDITSIAWETTRTINITNEFDYNCLYQLESMYNLQERLQREVDKAAEALQREEMEDLIRILEIMSQLDLQLKTNYDEMLQTINNCK
ncbi:DUF6090 family protein [Ichthyenterobacterium magnum]|uniref:Uncharacterized protein n=1 Tax=Ichthyenterobacterium magnum TaxID=1230530 RepID=A0A420DXK6_9FLAO|nr:DUF6090 family protein [Ichthyenterobacterium magnum]RKE98949.1 hypothetical protein BXY80_1044 [Ichthyenterobacterium magnum]